MRWTDSDNLQGEEAVVVGGPLDGLRVTVNERGGVLRHPDVIDLSGYRFDASLVHDWKAEQVHAEVGRALKVARQLKTQRGKP